MLRNCFPFAIAAAAAAAVVVVVVVVVAVAAAVPQRASEDAGREGFV